MATVFLVLIYIAFISLGLPDSLLGTAWPVMRLELGASLDRAGILAFIISGGTIISSLSSGRVVGRFGTGKVTAFSVLLTASALLGSSFSPSVWWLALMAVPLGLGAGAVDAALNNYVALHYAARHMSWLHCFWGVGALSGPLIIGNFLRRGDNWRGAYFFLALVQFGVSLLLLISLPLWKAYGSGPQKTAGDSPAKPSTGPAAEAAPAATSPGRDGILRIPGVAQALITFFLYCGTEYTVGLWGASFLSEFRGFSKAAAASAISMYFIGITAGRFLTGFLTLRFSGVELIRTGLGIITAGAVLLLLPLPGPFALAALLLIGFGCSPVYPSMIQLTPKRFGPENSPRVIGLQMACAYSGSTLLPPLAGFIAAHTTMRIIPVFLVCYGLAMIFMSEQINRKVPRD
ncbi:MAG: MFS transporter [Spirochaetaceae bacterium]|jgi:fucose permease|nr:MFS transporter [Spirochaetaceae bacterium]